MIITENVIFNGGNLVLRDVVNLTDGLERYLVMEYG